MPVIMMLPFLKPILEIITRPFKHSIEFLQIRLLGPLHLAVEVRSTRSVRAEFYAIIHKHFLDFYGKEFPSSICLNSLNRERADR